jgi:mono/diheme cytochrome c family protein
MMMGSYLTCAACHGVDGRGGSHTMHMQVMDAPDIRYAALNGEGEEHGEQDHAEGGTGYSLEDFRRAVTLGEHPDGEPLDSDMPRWRMSEEDLADLFEFIKNLP